MENHYIKQFPDLMKGKKIMYIHGFGSSAQSGTVRLIRQTFPEANVVARDVPLHPDEAIAMLHYMADSEKPDLIIGTSMGGMYGEQLRGYWRILVNPAFEMGETMRSHGMIGHQTYQNPREDGETEFIVTQALVKEYKKATEQCFKGITADDRKRVFGLFGDEDKLVNTYPLFAQHYAQAIHFHGGHRLDDKSFLDAVVPVVRWIDDAQEGRERPIVFIDINALRDENGHDRSSMRKAFRMFIESYRVFIIAPAPSNEPKEPEEVNSWIKKYLSAPAWNHIIYTNQPSLLYGDYMVTPSPDDNFAGTSIAFGSDEFKTWEETINYFELLGGQ